MRLLTLLLFAVWLSPLQAQPIRVIVYSNPPLASFADGTASGLFIDLLDDIARRRGWTIEYRGANFEEGMTALAAGEADLMPVVASSPERRKTYAFNGESVISNWAQMMVRRDSPFETIVQLANRRIAALEADIHLEGPTGLRKVMASFGISMEIVLADSYEEVARLVRDGTVDAGLMNWLRGRALADEYQLEASPIIFNPIGLYFAMPRAGPRSAELAEVLDEELRALKSESGGLYDRTVDRWLRGGRQLAINRWLLAAIVGLTVLLGIAVAILLAFRRLQGRLREAIEAAEEANRAKGDFLAGMSHELRTPLNAIIGYAELLAEDCQNPDDRRDLERIFSAGRHLQELIDEVLDLSKLEAGRMQIAPCDVDVAPLVQAVAATIAPLCDKAGNRLVVECPADIGHAFTDPLRLRQCLINLVGNASKFTREGTVTLAASRTGPWLTFVVSDTGVGIAPDAQQAIFQAFKQASTDDGQAGTGLGLAITRKLARLMGGDVSLTSTLGEGSTFTLRIKAELR